MNTNRKRLAKPNLRGMLTTRRGAFALAAACALAAIAILVFALGKVQNSVVHNAQQGTVLVSTAEIPKGSTADVIVSQRLYKVMPVVATSIAQGAISNAGSLTGQVAASNILPGQQLTSADFTATAPGLTGQLTPGERAVAVSLDPAHAVASLVKTGDQVDVYGSWSDQQGRKWVSLLVPDATILQGAGTGAAGSGGAGGTVVLGVGEQLTPRVMWMFDNGKIWLELRGTAATNAQPEITGLPSIALGDHLSSTPTYPAAAVTGVKR